MINKDLKKLSRAELLELLIAQTEENDKLRNQLRETEDKLLDKRITCENAGSLAEAALKLNGIFEAAQASCDQYLENIRLMSDPDAIKNTEEKCNIMIADARREADEYWNVVKRKIEDLTAKSPTLKKLLENEINDLNTIIDRKTEEYSTELKERE